MGSKIRLWPQTMRARLLLLIVPLLCIAVAVSGFILIARGKEAILAEKKHYLFGITRILQRHLDHRGGYAALEKNEDPDTLRVLKNTLAPVTEEVAAAFPKVGLGYYHRRLDSIVTYGPAEQFGSFVGHAIPADHPGRAVMASGQPAVESGSFIRGKVMNAMTPIREQGEIVGYIWANELVDDIEERLAGIRNTILIVGIATLFVALSLIYLIVTRLTRDVSVIKRGLHGLAGDLEQRLPALDGETGDIAEAINQMAQSLQSAQQKEREQARATLHQREETLRTAIEAIDEAFVLYDQNDQLVFCNDKYQQMLPPEHQHLLAPGRTYAEIAHALIRNGLVVSSLETNGDLVANLIEHHRRGEGHLEQKTSEGRWIRIIDRKTATGHIVGFRIDITNLKRATENAEAANRKLEELANRDSLTGLYNRRYMDRKTDLAWHETKLLGDSFGLLMIDADNFKRFNDRYGHQEGDLCLRAIADAIAGTVAAYTADARIPLGFAARYGGEEFAVILCGASHEAYATLAADLVVAVRALAIPHAENAGHGIASISVGGTFLPHAHGSIVELFRSADERLYRAKDLGRNRAETD